MATFIRSAEGVFLVLPDGAMSDPEHRGPEPAQGSLWAFAVRVYAAPGVADACLALQDRYGCDVNVLLFAAWIGAVRHRAITPAEMAETITVVQGWHAEIVRPLRDVRRRLKSGPLPAPSETTGALRARIKAVELESERIELVALEQMAAKWHSGLSDCAGGSSENLKAAVRHFTGGEPSGAALELIRAIEEGVATSMAAER
jgi:uncharacterized protein (TIGR02444 family)